MPREPDGGTRWSKLAGRAAPDLPGLRASLPGKQVQAEGVGMKAAGQRAERAAEREASPRHSGDSGVEGGRQERAATKFLEDLSTAKRLIVSLEHLTA